MKLGLYVPGLVRTFGYYVLSVDHGHRQSTFYALSLCWIKHTLFRTYLLSFPLRVRNNRVSLYCKVTHFRTFVPFEKKHSILYRMKRSFCLEALEFQSHFVLRTSKVRTLVRTNQFQVKCTKMGTRRKFVTFRYDVLPCECNAICEKETHKREIQRKSVKDRTHKAR